MGRGTLEVSENVASGLRDAISADNFRVLLLIQGPVLFGSSFLHFNLDVVLANLILAHDELARVLDQHSCVGLLDDVADHVG